MPPVGVKSSRPSRWPSWKTQTSTPSEAPSETTLISSALTGITTEPVMRNSRTRVPSATRPIAIRRPCQQRVGEVHAAPAAWPMTQVGKSGRSRSRSRCTTSRATRRRRSPPGTSTPMRDVEPIADGGIRPTRRRRGRERARPTPVAASSGACGDDGDVRGRTARVVARRGCSKNDPLRRARGQQLRARGGEAQSRAGSGEREHRARPGTPTSTATGDAAPARPAGRTRPSVGRRPPVPPAARSRPRAERRTAPGTG